MKSLALVLVASCYQPGTPPVCAIACSDLSPCPDGLFCNAGVCAASLDEGACGTNPPGDGADGPPDTDPSPFTECYAYGTGTSQFCIEPPTTGNLALGSGATPAVPVVNTMAFACADFVPTPSTLNVCVLAADKITISGTLRVDGDRPLVLIGAASIELVSGALVDVSSHDNLLGAGRLPDCPGVTAPEFITVAGGGGAGGSFSSGGGNGGNGVPSNAIGGKAGPAISATTLHGGCPGSAGAAAQVAMAGRPGAGGGAIAMLSHGTITVLGGINASGGAGGGGVVVGTEAAGGGGGGAGGMIVLAAATVRLQTGFALWANGGGGGEGASTAGTNGGDGGISNGPIGTAAGGVTTSHGGNGGKGGCCRLTTPQSGSSGEMLNGDAGGGGGGSMGNIQFPTTTSIADANSISPIPQTF